MTIKLLILVVLFEIAPSNSFSCLKGWPNEAWTTCENVSSADQIPHKITNNNHIYLGIKNSTISTLSSSFKLSKIKNLEILELRKTGIKTIVPGAFTNLATLKILDLAQNELRELSNGIFTNLATLEKLDLGQNELTELSNGIFNDLYNLQILGLYGNKIHTIEKLVLIGLVNLENLSLSKNNLSRLEDDLFKTQKRLNDLDLSDNPLKKSSLETLLSKFSNLSMHRLGLKSIQLSTFDFFRMPKTNFLLLSNNRIKKINVFFEQVSYLYMDYNRLRVLEKSIFRNSKNIIKIDFSFNEISTIDNEVFHGLTLLQHLNLGNNNITKLGHGLFKDLSNLTFLNLSHNKIDKFEFETFHSLEKLVTLDISNNRLMDLHPYIFESVPELLKLYFDNNQISSFDDNNLESLIGLTEVSLDKNPWNCHDLVKVVRSFEMYGTDVKKGDTYHASNFHGVGCSERNTSQKVSNFSKIGVTDVVKIPDSKMENFNIILISNSVIVAITCACMLFIAYLIFTFFKKIRQNGSTQLISDGDL